MKRLVTLLLLYFFVVISIVWAQEQTIDPFLDDNFIETEKEADNPDELEDKSSENSSILDISPEKEAYRLLKFSLQNTTSFSLKREDSLLNNEGLAYTSPWSDEILFNNYIQYRNAKRWLSVVFDYNLYFLGESSEHTTFSLQQDNLETLDTYSRYEIKESNVRGDFFQNRVSLKIGKILRTYGSGQLVNPSNPLTRKYGKDIVFSKQLSKESYDTSHTQTFVQERGSGILVGFWATEVELLVLQNLFPMVYRLAWVPKFQTSFEEFDRVEQGFLVSMGIRAWDNISPTFIGYQYGSDYFVGADTSISIGNSITVYGELGLSTENEFMILRKEEGSVPSDFNSFGAPTDTYDDYTLSQYNEDGLYLEALLGASYTPVIEGRGLFTGVLELYYNGKGLKNDEWKKQITHMQNIHDTYDETSKSTYESNLSSAYEGILLIDRVYYSPLRSRPLYILLNVYRDDVFSKTWKQDLYMSSSLVYSVFDTSFFWNNKMEVEIDELITIGVNTKYNFGLSYGAFTILSDQLEVEIFTYIKI